MWHLPGARHRPYCLTGAGCAGIFNSALPQNEGSGAPGNAEVCETSWAAGEAARDTLRRRLLSPCDRGKAPPGAPLAAFLSSDPFFRAGSDRSLAARSRIRRGFARLHPSHVQPLKAAPHSGGGRGPKASRARGYEPRPRAPPPAPPSFASRDDAPQADRVGRLYSRGKGTVNRAGRIFSDFSPGRCRHPSLARGMG